MKTFKLNRLLDVMYMGVILCASCSCSELELGDGLNTGKDAVPVSEIVLSDSEVYMKIGETKTVTAKVYPSDATDKTVVWSSSSRNEPVVKVENGKLTALKGGAAAIYAETRNRQVQAFCIVIVTTKVVADYIDEYGINHGKGIVIGETIWAPVNCGYHAEDFPYGKLYQWGRKYGQGLGAPYDKGTVTMTYGGVSLIEGQHSSNADKFFTGHLDWLATKDDKLWNTGTESTPKKSEYDPCPEGWRVPVKSELTELAKNYSNFGTLTDGQEGLYFSEVYEYSEDASKIFLPASGYRHLYVGSLHNVGDYGFYWSASPNSDRAYRLGFIFFNGVSSSRSGDRAGGYSVRCLQE